MSHDPRSMNSTSIHDKLELHHRQQLSTLVDGELAPDEARFLLRRMEHDGELSGRFERWQLCGDVLRGQVRRAAAPDLAARIAAGIAAAPAVAPVAAHAAQAPARRHQTWVRWGGGLALAASAAVVAVFVGGPVATDPSTAPATGAVAVQALPSTEAVLAAAEPAATEAPARVDILDNGRPTAPAPVRTRGEPSRMVASSRPAYAPAIAGAQTGLEDAVADAGPQVPDIALPSSDPFASPEPLQARPWPRAVMAQPASSAYAARFGAPATPRAFYPFEPRLSSPQAIVPQAIPRATIPVAEPPPVPADEERQH